MFRQALQRVETGSWLLAACSKSKLSLTDEGSAFQRIADQSQKQPLNDSGSSPILARVWFSNDNDEYGPQAPSHVSGNGND